MPSFSLDKEPWIPVIGLDGLAKEVSLVEVFENAPQIASISGSPLESAALTRMLLAIAHLVETPTSLTEWKGIWDDRHKFMANCADYVRKRHGVWDILHPTMPFGQVTNPTQGTRNPAHLLVYEAARKNNAVHLDHSLVRSPVANSHSRLARGIITSNAYAGSSGGGFLSGPLAMRTIGFLQSDCLADTLILNLLVQEGPIETFDWTEYGRSSQKLSNLDLPRRYLWSSRRIRFIVESDGQVKEMMLAPSEGMNEDDRKDDPMVALKLSADEKEYVPLRLEADKALWRSSHVLLRTSRNTPRLASIDQLRKIVSRSFLATKHKVSLRICAVSGDAQGPNTDLWRDELLPFGISIVADDEKFASLNRAVLAAEDRAEKAERQIYSFAKRYLQNGSSSAPDKNDVKRLANELAPDLHDYWAMLAPMGERIACDDFVEATWAELIDHASKDAVRKAINRLPADARRLRAEFARKDETNRSQKKEPKSERKTKTD